MFKKYRVRIQVVREVVLESVAENEINACARAEQILRQEGEEDILSSTAEELGPAPIF